MTKKVEYRVRPVTRYHVTRFEQDESLSGVECRGEFDHGATAYHVAYALCKAEHIASGEPVESVNFTYPTIPEGVSVLPK